MPTLLCQMAKAQSKNVSSKETSLIAHLVKEVNRPSFHSKGDEYLLVRIGKTEFIAVLKTGKIISRRNSRFPGGGICGDYAEVDTNLLDKNKKETAQGGSQILKLSGGKWKRVALAEGNYSCEDLKGVSTSVLKCLKVECF